MNWLGGTWLETVVQDVRLALRMFRRSPGFVAIALLSLGAGIGLNVAVFSFVNALFLRPIAGVADPGRLVSVFQRVRGGTGSHDAFSFPEIDYYAAASRSFSGLVGSSVWPMAMRVGGVTEEVEGGLVSPAYFRVLGIRPAAGRLFTGDEGGAAGSDAVVVLSHRWWKQRFGGDPAVVGRTIQVGRVTCTVVGVTPGEFEGMEAGDAEAAMWLPVSLSSQVVPVLAEHPLSSTPGNRSASCFGRLRPGVTLAAAQQEMRTLDRRYRHDFPEREAAWAKDGFGDSASTLLPAASARVSPDSRKELASFVGLLGASFVVILLIACFNLANLLLARTAARQKELALRLSLGAGRTRLLRQLLTENLLLAGGGALLGLVLARWAVTLLGSVLAGAPRTDLRVVAFAVGAALVSALVVTVLPMRLVQRADLWSAMKGAGADGVGGRGRSQPVLITAQIALSVVLLACAGLFLRTLGNARAVDPTSRPEQLVLAGLAPDGERYATEESRARFYTALLERIRATPGIRSAAAVMVVPLGGRRGGTQIELPAVGGPPQDVNVDFNVVSADHFATVGLPLVAGRSFSGADAVGSAPVAVVNEELARRLSPGGRVVGQRFRVKWPPSAIVEVVGVVRDGRMRSYRADIGPTVYVPLGQRAPAAMTLEVRGGTRAADTLRAVQSALGQLDGTLALSQVRTARAHFDRALSRERFNAVLLTALGAIALTLGAFGVFGLLSYAVTRRTREIGIRLAIGATPGTILRSTIGQAMRLTAWGLAIGLPAAFGLARLVQGFLFGVNPFDPLVFASAAGLLGAVGVLAGYAPARRASRMDPVRALRCE